MRIRQSSLGLLVALLGVYLTLVCPGHDRDGQHTAAHFTLLGEAAEPLHHAGPAPGHPLDTITCSAVPAPGGVSAVFSAPASTLIGGALQLTPATARYELDSLLILEIVPVAPALDRPPLLSSCHPLDGRGGAQISLAPEPPPPRPSAVLLRAGLGAYPDNPSFGVVATHASRLHGVNRIGA